MAKSNGFSEADLAAMGLVKNEDGSYSKPIKTFVGHKHAKEAKKVLEVARTPFELGIHEWFIPYQIPSKKNSTQLFVSPNGRPGTTTSKRYKEYIQLTKNYWEKLGIEFKKAIQQREAQFPLNVEFTFYRTNNQRFDYIGPGESVQDIMVDFGWIPDDDTKHLKPFYGDALIDKSNPGVKIKLL